MVPGLFAGNKISCGPFPDTAYPSLDLQRPEMFVLNGRGIECPGVRGVIAAHRADRGLDLAGEEKCLRRRHRHIFLGNSVDRSSDPGPFCFVP
jgi:hypothetical protein